MKLFFSHSSSDKSKVREIRRHLPSHLSSWMDEENLEVGSNLSTSIKRAIDSEVDLVVACLTPEAAASNWVSQELEWALERERQIDRVFVIPIVFGLNYEPPQFSLRPYIRCYDDSHDQIQLVANKLYTEVVKLAFKTIAKYESQNPTSDLAMRLCGNWIGSLSFDRFFQIAYSSMSPQVAQLGSVLYTIGREGKVLSGKFIGYTPGLDKSNEAVITIRCTYRERGSKSPLPVAKLEKIWPSVFAS